jgi:hypothetical protein
MRAVSLIILLLAFTAIPALASDLEKAEKQIRMMTALSRDDTARSIVSRTFSDVFKVPRPELVAERKSLALNYGSVFLVHELLLTGVTMQQISSQLRMRKGVLEIASSSSADWKRIESDAKKMNDRINKGIYKHFLHDERDKQRDLEDHYVASADLIRVDADSTPAEIQKAQADYVFWRNLAAPKSDEAADRSTPVGKSYEQGREDMAITHGNTPTGPTR